MVRHTREELLDVFERLAEEEQGILVEIGERLCKGQSNYGALTPTKDRRDFVQETIEEVMDALVYSAVQLRQLQDADEAYGKLEQVEEDDEDENDILTRFF